MHQHIRIVIALGLAAAVAGAYAQEAHHGHPEGGPGRGGHGPGGARALQFDDRYHHDHYYPARGFVTGALPGGAVSIGFRGGNYFYHGGVWFRPYGPRFQVVVPPVGIVVPFLPGAYASLWLGGAPYYYANGVYYAPAPGGYAVVAPPPGADDAQPAPPPAAPLKAVADPIVYPRNGQSAQQTEADRQQCNTWATTQPGAVADASVFQRAVAACMDARGYTVR